jgi:DNA invertase Pin-like site-specific DNA recombinase
MPAPTEHGRRAGGARSRRRVRRPIHGRGANEHGKDGQIRGCQRFLTANLPRECTLEQVNVKIIREPEISAEIADRRGINQVWAGIKAHRWDVILAEESSRLYRHMKFASQFFDTAVDAGIRVICPTDFIDTADEDWPERLHAALGHHGRANHFTRRRIKRAQENRWLSGAAMGPLAIGSRRRPSIPATATDPARGPFFDSIDEERKPVIVTSSGGLPTTSRPGRSPTGSPRSTSRKRRTASSPNGRRAT